MMRRKHSVLKRVKEISCCYCIIKRSGIKEREEKAEVRWLSSTKRTCEFACPKTRMCMMLLTKIFQCVAEADVFYHLDELLHVVRVLAVFYPTANDVA